MRPSPQPMPLFNSVVLKDDTSTIDPFTSEVIDQDEIRMCNFGNNNKLIKNGKKRKWEKFAKLSESGKSPNYSYVTIFKFRQQLKNFNFERD